ncbi:unnamed protein product [Dovyalis caffra]|uniref:Uncharacterized protein n=1 Tax=Dovyalis caffra TaxID=77055 RepID=A0AAV1QQ85_9ROSI|nr:unnamed protein product [Dovyalis caffra]
MKDAIFLWEDGRSWKDFEGINEKRGFLIDGDKYRVHAKEIKSDFPDFNLFSSMLEKSAARKLEERVDDVDATVESDVAADMIAQLDDTGLILWDASKTETTDSDFKRNSLAGSLGRSRVMDSQFHVVAELSGAIIGVHEEDRRNEAAATIKKQIDRKEKE